MGCVVIVVNATALITLLEQSGWAAPKAWDLP
jgi:hypothetical protein